MTWCLQVFDLIQVKKNVYIWDIFRYLAPKWSWDPVDLFIWILNSFRNCVHMNMTDLVQNNIWTFTQSHLNMCHHQFDTSCVVTGSVELMGRNHRMWMYWHLLELRLYYRTVNHFFFHCTDYSVWRKYKDSILTTSETSMTHPQQCSLFSNFTSSL